MDRPFRGKFRCLTTVFTVSSHLRQGHNFSCYISATYAYIFTVTPKLWLTVKGISGLKAFTPYRQAYRQIEPLVTDSPR
jgi:hypothetical protein